MALLRVPARMSQFDTVECFVLGLLTDGAHGPDDILAFRLASEEIFMNIVSYAYGPDGGEMEVVCETADDSSMTVRFMDRGVPFNPLELDVPDTAAPLEEREAGRGSWCLPGHPIYGRHFIQVRGRQQYFDYEKALAGGRAMSLNLSKKVNKDNVTIVVDGRIDAGTVTAFREEMMAALEETAGDIVLECANLEYVSSIGLRVFLTTQKELQKKNRHLEMRGVQEPIVRILRTTGFDTFIKVV